MPIEAKSEEIKLLILPATFFALSSCGLDSFSFTKTLLASVACPEALCLPFPAGESALSSFSAPVLAVVLDSATDAESGEAAAVVALLCGADSSISAFIRMRNACSNTSWVMIASVRARTLDYTAQY